MPKSRSNECFHRPSSYILNSIIVLPINLDYFIIIVSYNIPYIFIYYLFN